MLTVVCWHTTNSSDGRMAAGVSCDGMGGLDALVWVVLVWGQGKKWGEAIVALWSSVSVCRGFGLLEVAAFHAKVCLESVSIA
jgi:hypothetical protein